MRKILFTLFLLLQIVIVKAQTYQPGNLASIGFHETIPFDWVKDKIIIPVQINGNTYHFIFDTGAVLFISSKVQQECGLNKSGTTVIRDANADRVNNELFTVPELRINNIQFTNLKAIKSDFFDIYPVTCLRVDGIIGSDLLTKMLVQFDWKNQQLTLTDQPERLSLLPQSAIKMTVDKKQGAPYISIQLSSGIRERVLFDSGSDDFLTLSQASFEKLRKKRKIQDDNVVPVFGSFSLGASGIMPPPSDKYLIRFDVLNIGNGRIQHIITDFTNPAGSRLGAQLLKYGTVTLDFPNRKFYFKPYAADAKFDAEAEFGFRVRPTDQRLVVSGIFRDSEAEKSGLRVGHTILKIDNEDFSKIESENCQYFLNGYDWQQREQITVTFLDDQDEQRTIILKKIIF